MPLPFADTDVDNPLRKLLQRDDLPTVIDIKRKKKLQQRANTPAHLQVGRGSEDDPWHKENWTIRR